MLLTPNIFRYPYLKLTHLEKKLSKKLVKGTPSLMLESYQILLERH